MTLLESILLGVIQGLTEFLPISSTAHLKIVPDLLGLAEPGAAFSAVIQWGTFVSAVVYFRKDILALLSAFFRDLRNRTPFASQESRLAWMIALGTIPIVVLGVLLKKSIEGEFRSLYVIAWTQIFMAAALMLAEGVAYHRAQDGVPGKGMDKLGWFEAACVGLAQAVALVPGASRSGVTMTAGLLVNFDRATAARYSFLLSLPAIFGAGLYQAYKERAELLATTDSVVSLVVATVVSGVVGYLAIEGLMRFLKTRTMLAFVAYRVALGVFILAMLGAGRLTDSPPGPRALLPDQSLKVVFR